MSERIILTGKAAMLKPVITEILALHQLIENRDIGEFVGNTLEDSVRARPQPLKLKILYYNVPSPPWESYKNNVGVTRVTCNVPFVSRSKVDWETIKTACGGANGYFWGRFCCTANLSDSNGNIRKMRVYGGSKSEAEQRLRALFTLTNSTIVTLSNTEEEKEGRRATDKHLYKETKQVYPAYFTIVHQEKIAAESNLPTLSGNYRRTKFRIPLWTSTKPVDADERIREALRIRGSDPTP